MIRINLLPHRAEKRKAQQVQFIAFSVISIIIGAVVVGLVHLAIVAQIDNQERRNAYLNKEIAILDKQIDEIKKLREQTKSLLARKNVVENLQSTRSDVVHLMDQMLRILPDGVYLKSIKQTGDKVDLVGFAQSNARVSTLMRSISDSPWLEKPVLVEIHTTTTKGSNSRTSEFLLNFYMIKQAPPSASAAKKPSINPPIKNPPTALLLPVGKELTSEPYGVFL